MLDLSRAAYLFAQGLDDQADPEYWAVRHSATQYDKLDLDDDRLRLIREAIDGTSASTQSIPTRAPELECRASLSGTAVVSLKPATLDVNGRTSPVLVLFNLYGGARRHVATALRAVPDLMGRELSQDAEREIERLDRILRWPMPLLFLLILFRKCGEHK